MNKSRTAARALALLFAMTGTGQLLAETITFQAITDFPSIDAGEVPYYTEEGRGSLAINASVEEYRDKFARASTSYSGEGGTYDVTLSTFGELDGDCEYRFLVNGTVVGTAVNDPVTVDYTVQQHTFADISIPAGATLSVESNALSNGLIPEGDIFAFARGRWNTLTLQNDSPASTPIDLQLTAALDNASVNTGDSFSLTLETRNLSTTETATLPVVTLALPAAVTVTSSECTESPGGLTCILSEVGPGQSQSLSLSGVAKTSGQLTLEASVSADQTDSSAANNTASATLNITQPVITPISVDLQLEITGDGGSDDQAVTVGDTINYMLSAANVNSSNVATAPTVGVILPDNLAFQSSADCALEGINVMCYLSELAPNTATAIAFSVTAVAAGDSTLIASISATEADDVVADNEVVLPVSVVGTSPASSPDDNESGSSGVSSVSSGGNSGANSGANSGGGGISLLLAFLLLCRRTRLTGTR